MSHSVHQCNNVFSRKLAKPLEKKGTRERCAREVRCGAIGAKLDAIKKAEDRDLFKRAMRNIGLKTPPSGSGQHWKNVLTLLIRSGVPLIIRPRVHVGWDRGGIAYNREEFEAICKSGLAASVTSQVLVEKSLLGWKEYELEVMRDLADNVVIICSIENIDPMGVHTGDSITVAPAQTLTDKEYQRLRDYSIAIIREIGVECGGSNVQFAVNPEDGEVMVIEMNPRVSRSSALASKATGFPIAKMAAKLSVGYSLDQIPNDITKKTPASFEPSIDYVVTKIPRFAFEKFPGSEPILTTQMKSVGESMAVGRTFQESFQKALRSLECGYSGWGCAQVKELNWDWEQLKYSLRVPSPDRIHSIYAAMKRGMKVDDIHELSFIDKWFLTQLKELVDVEQYILARNLSQLTKDDFWEVKRRGFSDKQIAFATKSNEHEVRSKRLSLGVKPAYKRVDTCAAEFEADTPYMYSSYEVECESAPTKRQKVLILGGGPNRIGQGIEFDYCCCHTSFALQDAGYETIMMNSNPETVSTDYDTSDRLYFEPLTVEDVLNIIDLEGPDGIIVQFGGQTPLKLSLPIQRYLDEQKPKCKSGSGFVRIWGTSPDSIDAAEDRERFNAILTELKIEQPKGGIAKSDKDALAIAANIGYPVVDPERPVLIDKYLSDAIEIDIDALRRLARSSRDTCRSKKPFSRSRNSKALTPFSVLRCEARAVMGIHYESSIAFAKAQIAAGQKPPLSGTVFLSLNDLTKPHLAAIARAFVGLGFELVATSGTARVLELEAEENGAAYKIPVITTVAGALATAEAIKSLKCNKIEMTALQDYFSSEKENESSSKSLQSVTSTQS
ncbi:hypothetical protein DH2020_035197 [Rehmannia glutinosa]|uniref:carbamoyl-phosphate synthase (ammonia) n=1 Tax=Rehmannia glutinosa TaxID=99300 RepID=A0ABR0VA35_REHGL